MCPVFYSCEPGMALLKSGDRLNFKQDFIELLEIKNHRTYYTKIKRYRNIPVNVKSAIEDLFVRYGVPPDKIWNVTM